MQSVENVQAKHVSRAVRISETLHQVKRYHPADAGDASAREAASLRWMAIGDTKARLPSKRKARNEIPNVRIYELTNLRKLQPIETELFSFQLN